MGTMAVESKTRCAIPAAYRRFLVWAQIVAVYLFLEFALWAPTPEIRNRWAAIAVIAILVFILTDVILTDVVLIDVVLTDVSIDRSSLKRFGLGLPTISGAKVVLGAGFATAVLMVILVSWAGGQIPANTTWPGWRLAWGYAIWAMIQEFMLQSFFFTRCEELYGSSAAVWMASTLFAAAHLPSPVLTTAALIGALFFCEMFRRYRSVYLLGIVHAMLGLTIAILMPDSLLHHMRVGIGYLRYR